MEVIISSTGSRKHLAGRTPCDVTVGEGLEPAQVEIADGR